MEKWYQKLRRGDVWWVSLPTEKGDNVAGSSVQKKSRPYLIVSNEINNQTAPIVNAVPISTRDRDDYPMHVYYRVEEDGGRNQVILCEQITTLSVLLFNKSSTFFMYSLAPILMEKVDKALACQLSLALKPAGLEELERFINKLAEQKLDEIQNTNSVSVEQQVSKIVHELESKFNSTPTERTECKAIKESKAKDSKPEVISQGLVTDQSDTSAGKNSTSTVVRKALDRWTPELKQQFISEYDRMTVPELMARYTLTKKRVYQIAWLIRNERKQQTEGEKSKQAPGVAGTT